VKANAFPKLGVEQIPKLLSRNALRMRRDPLNYCMAVNSSVRWDHEVRLRCRRHTGRGDVAEGLPMLWKSKVAEEDPSLWQHGPSVCGFRFDCRSRFRQSSRAGFQRDLPGFLRAPDDRKRAALERLAFC